MCQIRLGLSLFHRFTRSITPKIRFKATSCNGWCNVCANRIKRKKYAKANKFNATTSVCNAAKVETLSFHNGIKLMERYKLKVKWEINFSPVSPGNEDPSDDDEDEETGSDHTYETRGSAGTAGIYWTINQRNAFISQAEMRQSRGLFYFHNDLGVCGYFFSRMIEDSSGVETV